jgi:hypothetical protein
MIDFKIMTPTKQDCYRWFMNEFVEIKRYRFITLKSMNNIIRSKILSREEKENYLKLRRLNEEI